ncbi:MAG: carboxypeptidase-like regulatory domain-containing protein, partial [Bacteroidales bacterium]
MKQPTLFLTLLLLPIWSFCQNYIITGNITDKKTAEPLAFVNVLSNDGRGAITDIDGKFTMNVGKNTHVLSISYVGYQPLVVDIDTSR